MICLTGEYYDSIENEKNCSCFQECEEIHYEVSMSSAYYPNAVISDMLLKYYGLDFEYFR